MQTFQHNFPSLRILHGESCLDNLPREIRKAGGTRALVISGHTLADDPSGVPRLKAILGETFAGVFDGVEAHSPLPSVERAASAINDMRADTVITLGGGSAIVTARAAVILHAEQKPIGELHTRFAPGQPPISPKLIAAKLPIFVIPTTPTTAAPKVGAAILYPETGERLTLFDPKTRAQAIFIDAKLIAATPASLVLDAGLHAFSTAVQGLESSRREPIADAGLIHALRLLAEALPLIGTPKDNATIRGQLILAATLAGEASDHTGGGGLASVIGHALGSRSKAGNGQLNALLLPGTIRFNASATGKRLAVVAEILRLPGSGPGEACRAYFSQLGLPMRLRDIGIDEAIFPEIVAAAWGDWFLYQNPRQVRSDEELIAVLRAAY